MLLFSLGFPLWAQDKPNLVIILADDMGYSDIGCFGSEIATPNLDRLAANGLRLTRFYNAARCCPSRAALLTGLAPHQAGIGLMTDQTITIPSYQGYLQDDCVTLPQLLKEAGYDTYISGKWHVGEERDQWPLNYGFDRCLSLINGAASYFDNGPYRASSWPWGGEVVTALDNEAYDYPEGRYSTDLYTDYALEFINGSHQRKTPFFLYLAYTAPHWPLHALPEDIRKYDGRYSEGWNELRRERYARQVEMGLFPAEWDLPPPGEDVRDWEELNPEQQEEMANRMEVYAAMVDRMDQNIGRVVDALEATGELDNTLIIFLSDNGAAKSAGIGHLHERFSRAAPVGTPQSFTAYGPGWASASNTPFRHYKSQAHEGGIATPFIAHYPAMIKERRLDRTVGHITDLLMTYIDLAGVEYPDTYDEKQVPPAAGTSLVPLFKGERITRQNPLVFEHMGNKAVIDEPLKLVKLHNEPWELYDLDRDRTETDDLIDTAPPETIADLLSKYSEWAREVGAFPRDIVQKRTVVEDEQ